MYVTAVNLLRPTFKLGMVVHTAVSALRRQRQDAQTFEATLGYIVRPCLKKNDQKEKEGGTSGLHYS